MIYLPHAGTKTDRCVSRSGPLLMLALVAWKGHRPRSSSGGSPRWTSPTRSSCSGAALLICVLPFVILLSSLADHRIDTDLGRLNRQGAVIVSQLFRSSPAHSAAAIVTALILPGAGTMAVARSLQLTYERVLGQQHRGWTHVPRVAAPAGVLFGFPVAGGVINEHARAVAGPAGQELVTYTGGDSVSSGRRCTSCWPGECHGAVCYARLLRPRCCGSAWGCSPRPASRPRSSPAARSTERSVSSSPSWSGS